MDFKQHLEQDGCQTCGNTTQNKDIYSFEKLASLDEDINFEVQNYCSFKCYIQGKIL